MFPVPFELERLAHRVFVVDDALDPIAVERLAREILSLDRARERATVLCSNGPFPPRDLIKGLETGLSELPPGVLDKRSLFRRARYMRDRLTELAPSHVEVMTEPDRSLWKVASRFVRPAARPELAARPPRSARRVAVLLKSDLARASAHVGQALNTAAALTGIGLDILVVGPVGEGTFEDAIRRATPGIDDASATRLSHRRLDDVHRSAATVRGLHDLLVGLADEGYGLLYFRQVRLASMLLPAARRLGFTVVMEAHQPFTTWAIGERRRLWSASVPPPGAFSTMARIDHAYERRVYAEVDGVICTTNAMRKRVRRLRPETPTLVLRNGAPDPATVAAAAPDDAGGTDVIYTGRTSSEKGTDVLLRAIAALPGVTATIVGGPAEDDIAPYRELATSLGLGERVRLLPWEDQARLLARVRSARVAVHPLPGSGSREWRIYTCPLKVLEAMALGTPVVATNLPALRELIRDGVHGLLVEPGDPGALANGIYRILSDPALAAALARAARRRARRFFHSARAERLARFIEQVARR